MPGWHILGRVSECPSLITEASACTLQAAEASCFRRWEAGGALGRRAQLSFLALCQTGLWKSPQENAALHMAVMQTLQTIARLPRMFRASLLSSLALQAFSTTEVTARPGLWLQLPLYYAQAFQHHLEAQMARPKGAGQGGKKRHEGSLKPYPSLGGHASLRRRSAGCPGFQASRDPPLGLQEAGKGLAGPPPAPVSSLGDLTALGAPTFLSHSIMMSRELAGGRRGGLGRVCTVPAGGGNTQVKPERPPSGQG